MKANDAIEKRINIGYFVKPTDFARSHLNYALGLGFLENDRQFIIDRPYFPGYLIMSCISGKMWLEQYGEKICIMPGESCLMTLRHPHKYYYDEESPCSIVWMQFDGEQVAGTVSLIFEGKEMFRVIEDPEIPALIQNCIEIYKTEGSDSAFSLSASIYSALMIFLESFIKTSEGYFNMPLAKKLNSFLEKHMGERITLEQMADFCHFNQSYFCRRFLKETGVTPMQYLQKKRIEGAKFLLLNTNYKLSYISQELGFYDQNHFSYCFKKETGISPTAYRRQATPF